MPTNDPVVILNPTESSNEPINDQPVVTNTPNMNVTPDVPPTVTTEPNQVNSDSFVNQTVPNVDLTPVENSMPTNDPVVILNPTESSNEPINDQPVVTNTDDINQVNPTDNLVKPAEDTSSSDGSPSFPVPENQSTETQDSSQGNI
jgi:hypothetical protein